MWGVWHGPRWLLCVAVGRGAVCGWWAALRDVATALGWCGVLGERAVAWFGVRFVWASNGASLGWRRHGSPLRLDAFAPRARVVRGVIVGARMVKRAEPAICAGLARSSVLRNLLGYETATDCHEAPAPVRHDRYGRCAGAVAGDDGRLIRQCAGQLDHERAGPTRVASRGLRDRWISSSARRPACPSAAGRGWACLATYVGRQRAHLPAGCRGGSRWACSRTYAGRKQAHPPRDQGGRPANAENHQSRSLPSVPTDPASHPDQRLRGTPTTDASPKRSQHQGPAPRTAPHDIRLGRSATRLDKRDRAPASC